MASRVAANAADVSAARSGPPNSVTSAPAEKIRSLPVITTAPGRSAARASTFWRSSASNPSERAFTGGRSRRTNATFPTRSAKTVGLTSATSAK